MSLITREELDAVSNHISNIPPVGAMYAPVLVEHCRVLLAEVTRLTDERDDAFRRGVAAMRETAANEIAYKIESLSEQWSDDISALPDPKDDGR